MVVHVVIELVHSYKYLGTVLDGSLWLAMFFSEESTFIVVWNLIMADKNWFVSHIEVASNISGKSQGQLKYLSS